MEKENNETSIERVNNLYSVICNGELPDTPEAINTRVNIIRELEKLTKSDFKSTLDFHQKVGSFLIKAASNLRSEPLQSLRTGDFQNNSDNANGEEEK
mgnify:CR=1 FL=1